MGLGRCDCELSAGEGKHGGIIARRLHFLDKNERFRTKINLQARPSSLRNSQRSFAAL
jgi:hypothetical protein